MPCIYSIIDYRTDCINQSTDPSFSCLLPRSIVFTFTRHLRLTLEGLFDHFNHSVDLLHANDAHTLEEASLGLALRHAPGHHHGLARLPSCVNLVLEMVFGWCLHRAAVQQPDIGVILSICTPYQNFLNSHLSIVFEQCLLPVMV